MKPVFLASIGAAVLGCGQTAVAQSPQTLTPTMSPIGSSSGAGSNGSLIVDEQRADRAPVLPASGRPAMAQSGPVVGAQPAGAPILLKSIRFEGATLPQATLVAALGQYQNKPVTNELLQALANEVTAVYVKSDIALFNVFIPSQTLADGQLIVQITEGSISQVEITGDVQTRHLRLIKKYAAKLSTERPLRKVTLERYLSLIRDIPGLTVEPKLTATNAPGVQVMTLDIKRREYRAQITFNDRGNERLGRVQLQGQATAYSLFQQGDQTVLTVAAPTEWDPFQYVGLNHVMPVGSNGLTVAATVGYLRTRPKDSDVRGEAKNAGVTATYPIKRGFNENLYVTAALDGQDADNAAFGQSISSDHSRTVRVGLSWSKQSPKSASSFSASVSQGLNALGADVDARLTDADYTKLNLYVARNQALGESFVARVRATAQLSTKRLPNVEQFTLGGEQFGRAFPTAYLLGDQGAAVSGELAWLPKTMLPAYLQGSEIYTFADYGVVTLRERVSFIPRRTYDLASAGLGARLNYKRKTVFNVEGATAIEKPVGGEDAWRFSFGWRSLF